MIFSITFIAYIALFISEILLNRMLRSKSTDAQNADKNSTSVIWITIMVAVALAVYISMRYYLPVSTNPLVIYMGTALIFIGIIVRLWAVYTLGRYFTVDVTIRKDHRIKKDGFYRYLRHPTYAASLLSFVGMGLTFNNWISLLLVTVPVLIVFIHRMKIEESVLVRHFGEEYIAYMKDTKRLVPFIY